VPHITLEVTCNVDTGDDPQELLAGLHRLVHEIGGARLGNCKSRLRLLETFRVGDGAPGSGFVHCEIRLLEGRPVEAKQELGRAALEFLTGRLAPVSAKLDLQVTVEVGDLPKALYFKYPAGTLGTP